MILMINIYVKKTRTASIPATRKWRMRPGGRKYALRASRVTMCVVDENQARLRATLNS